MLNELEYIVWGLQYDVVNDEMNNFDNTKNFQMYFIQITSLRTQE